MHKNRKKHVLVIFGVFATMVVTGIVILVFNNSTNIVSRYHWIKMLTERFGIEEYTSVWPLVPDVNAENEYYPYIQVACEWGIIEEGERFEGDKAVTGRYAALTVMRAIGQQKIKIYLAATEELSDNDYLELARQENIIIGSQMYQRITEEECKDVLERASELYLNTLWKDDICNITYQENVIDMSSATIISMKDDLSQVQLTSEDISSLATGDVVILRHPRTREQFAAEITGLGAANTIFLARVGLEQVLDSLLLSDIASFSATDILAYYDLTETLSSKTKSPGLMPIHSEHYVAEPIFNKSWHDEGFAITLEAKDNALNLMLTDHNTGLTCLLPIEEELEPDAEVNAKLDVRRIAVGTQIEYTAKAGLNYAYIQMESDMQVSGNISINKEKKIPLFKAPIYFGDGIAGVELRFYLLLSLDGTIQIEAEVPFGVSVEYIGGVGVREHSLEYDYTQPSFFAECDAGIVVRTEAILKLFMVLNVLDVEGDVGVNINATFQNRQHGNILSCLDVSVNMPIITVYLSGSDEIEPPPLLGLAGISGEWNVIDTENAPIQKRVHVERDLAGNVSLVEKCTYVNTNVYDGSHKEDTDDELSKVYWYGAYFDTPFVDKGDFYEVTGRLVDRVVITDSQLKSLALNDIYTYKGAEFIYKEKKFSEATNLKGQAYYEFWDREGNIYWVYPWSGVGSNDGEMEHWFEPCVQFEPGIQPKNITYVVLDDNHTFKIPKTTSVGIRVGFEEDDEGGSSYNFDFHPIAEIYNNRIEDCEGQRLGYDFGLYVNVLFISDAQGVEHISSISLSDIPEQHKYITLKAETNIDF